MVETAPAGNRFAHWQPWPARLALLLALVMVVVAAFTPIVAAEGQLKSVFDNKTAPVVQSHRQRDDDLQLYDRVTERLRRGENYYTVAAAEHRASDYPLRPGFAVRLPTLAVIEAHLPPPADPMRGGMAEAGLASLLLVGIMLVWWRRLGEEAGSLTSRPLAMALLFIGAQVGTIGYFYVLHELWAGALLALSLGLHRPDKGKWLGAWLAAAAALAIREHSLPFVLLMAAFAGWHRRRNEALAWTALVLLFIAGLSWHLHLVGLQVRPSDPVGPSWLTLRGLSGWLSMIVLSSNLRLLPGEIAGPLIMLAMVGWAGWRSSLGTFAILLFAGYGLAFMIAGRPDNWYWGMMVAPALLVGLAFAPMATKALWQAAFPSQALASRKALAQG